MNAFAVAEVPELRAGDDIAEIVAERTALEDGDIICVASTIVSKVESRAFDLEAFPAGERAIEIAEQIAELAGESKDPRFAQAVIEASSEIVMEAPFILAVTQFGHVAVNAGIDRSNTGGAELLLLPEDPTASAARIRDGLDADVGVVVTDTCGRPFRHGQTGIALGWDGLPASRDWRGELDRDGHELEVTVESVVDELAATANLVTGEGDDGTPVVVIRDWEFGDHEASETLFREHESDFVRQALEGWSYAGD